MYVYKSVAILQYLLDEIQKKIKYQCSVFFSMAHMSSAQVLNINSFMFIWS